MNLLYYKDLLKIGNEKSPVAIVTLWTICNEVIKELDKETYSVAGQLYTKNGLDYLVRNLLANKHIRYLIICGQDRSGSGKELLNLWKNKDSEFVSKPVYREAIKRLVDNVQLIDYIGIAKTFLIEDEIRKLDKSISAYGTMEVFEEARNAELNSLECSFPTDNSVFKVTGDTIVETWYKALKTILRFGDVKDTDSMKMKEVLNLCAVVRNESPDDFWIPSWCGVTKEKIDEYLPQIISPEKLSGLHYTYGHRLRGHFGIDQIDQIIKKLKTDNNARECVGVLFDPKIDHEAEHRPCITLVQFLRNRGVLNMNIYVRSHDIFGGWLLNAFGMRTLHKEVCDKASLPMGVMTMISASGHIYDFNWQQTLDIVKRIEFVNDGFEQDQRGFFKIDRVGEYIYGRHYSNDNLLLKEYKVSINDRDPVKELVRQIDSDNAVSLTQHAFYLGSELALALEYSKQEKQYVQS